MTDAISPALSAEEWRDRSAVRGVLVLRKHASELMVDGGGASYAGAPSVVMSDDPYWQHALAALALHGQPFGFTHAHAKALRDVLDEVDFDGMDLAYWAGKERAALLREAAAVIEALLPPNG